MNKKLTYSELEKRIQELEEAEKALQKNLTLYNGLIETTNTGFVILDQEGKVIDANQEYVRLSGHKNLSQIYGRSVVEWTADYEKEKNAEAVDKCFREGQIRNLNIDYINAQGKITPIEINATVIKVDEVTKILTLCRDITERRQAEEALRDSEGRFKTIFDNANDGIIMVDNETKKFDDCNNAICQMLGYSLEEIKNLGVADIHPKEDLPYVIEQFEKQARREIAVAKDIPVKRKDGSVFYSDINSTPITLAGKTYLLGLFRDVTEHRKAEEQKLKMQKLEAIGNLAAGIAHNFNNVLAGILGNISCIKEQYSDDKELYEIIEDVEKASLRGKNLASQLVTFASGGAPIKKIVSIEKLIKDSANFALSSSNVKYEFNIADNLGLVNIDEGQISKVIANLVENANQAMPDGGVINIQAENILFKNREYSDLQEGRYIKIAVKDHGVGIPKDKLSKIFDPFFSTKEGRTGIGLSTAYSIIKRHNGQIDVESEPGKGAIFNIYLPVS